MENLILEGSIVRLEPLHRSHLDGLLEAASGDRTSFRYTDVPEDAESMLRYIDRRWPARTRAR